MYDTNVKLKSLQNDKLKITNKLFRKLNTKNEVLRRQIEYNLFKFGTQLRHQPRNEFW